MPSNALNFPTLTKRLTLGSPLTFAQGDANLTDIQNFCIALANLIAGSLNPDGSLIANAVTASSIEQAAVGIGAINPAALYSLLPIGVDTGVANSNAYVIYTNGSTAPTNLVAGGAAYDDAGSYALPVSLTPNLYYYWAPGLPGYDSGIQINPSTTVSSPGVFQATQGSVTLKGSIREPVGAKVYLAANVTAYANGQTFLVYTANASSGPSTLNVNSLGNIPIKLPGSQNTTTGSIGSNSVFMVVYWNGQFLMVAGGGSATTSSSGSGTTVISENSFTGQNVFTAQASFPGAGGTAQIAHGLHAIPNGVSSFLTCTVAYAGFKVGQRIALSSVFDSIKDHGFLTYADSVNVYVSQSSNLLYTISPAGNTFTGGTGIAVTGGSGSGAAATVSVTAGAVTGITITTAGSSYVAGDIVGFTDATGIGLYAAVTTVSTGGITGLGPFYVNVPIISSKFALIVSATSTVTYPVPVFPALEYMVNDIEGAMGYGLNLFTVQYGQNRGTANFNNINLQNNEVTLLTPPSGTNYAVQNVNGAVFNTTLNNNNPIFVFGSNYGLYTAPTTNPVNYVVPSNTVYNSSGIYNATVTTGVTYTWTPGVNDLSIQNGSGGTTYLASGGPVVIVAAGTTLILTGTPSVVVTASLASATGLWQPTFLFNSGSVAQGGWKPAAIYPTTGSITEVYCISSLGSGQNISAITMYCCTSGAQNQYVGASSSNPSLPNLNLTNASIQNIAAFAGASGSSGSGWYQSGSGARILMLQFNPITNRLYLVTNETNFIHIFQITGTGYTSSGATALARGKLVDWWAATAGREAALSYIKSVAIGGNGSAWTGTSAENMTVDFDMATGIERAIVFTRQGQTAWSGSVTRVPWVE